MNAIIRRISGEIFGPIYSATTVAFNIGFENSIIGARLPLSIQYNFSSVFV